MKAIVTGYQIKPSKHGSIFYHIFFKAEDGKSYLTHAYPHYRNFKNWQEIISSLRRGEEVSLDGLIVMAKNIIDADSRIRRIK